MLKWLNKIPDGLTGGALRELREYCLSHPLPPTQTTQDHWQHLERTFLSGITT